VHHPPHPLGGSRRVTPLVSARGRGGRSEHWHHCHRVRLHISLSLSLSLAAAPMLTSSCSFDSRKLGDSFSHDNPKWQEAAAPLERYEVCSSCLVALILVQCECLPIHRCVDRQWIQSRIIPAIASSSLRDPFSCISTSRIISPVRRCSLSLSYVFVDDIILSGQRICEDRREGGRGDDGCLCDMLRRREIKNMERAVSPRECTAYPISFLLSTHAHTHSLTLLVFLSLFH
jgi:hypothetical protein